MQLKNLLLSQLQRGVYQPRRDFNEQGLRELADSIRSQGLIEPLIVRAIAGEGAYEIIAGERRWRAAMLAGLASVPCLVSQYTDAQSAAVSIIENVQRADLNPLEEAYAYQRLQEEFSYPQETIAQQVGKSRSHIANVLRLLGLTPKVKEAIISGDLSFGHARTLVGLEASVQWQLASQSMQYQWSVRKLEQQVKQHKSSLPAKSMDEDTSADIRHLENRLADHLAAPVTISSDAQEGGWLKIRYFDFDTLEGVLAKMGLDLE